MAKAFRQTSFAGGELSPDLYGRSDLAKYGVGLRRMRNFFSSRQGAAVSRPGTVYVAEVKNSSAGKVRLIDFVYSDGTSYVLEFGAGYIRFFSQGAPVLSGGVPYEVVTPYALADLWRLKHSQVGAVMDLTLKGYPSAKLTYTSATSWAYVADSFDRPAPTISTPTLRRFAVTPAAPNTVPVDFSSTNGDIVMGWDWQVTEVTKDSKGNLVESSPLTLLRMELDYYLPWNANITYALGTFVTSGATQYRSIQASNLNHAVSDGAWWVVDATSVIPTPVQSDVLVPVVVGPSRPVVLKLGAIYGLIATDPNFITYRVYRGQGGAYGWVGDTKTATFTDIGAAPDYTNPPPQGLNPFKVFNSDGTLNRTEHPACVAHFEERAIYGGTSERPGFVFASRTGDYTNFDSPLLPIASSALSFELASRKFEEIRSIVPVGPKLVAFTQSSFWTIGGSSGPMEPSDIDAKRQGEVGSSWVDPLVLDEGVLFVRSKGTGVRAANSDLLRQGLTSVDLSIMAQHLFINHQVLDWCHIEDPWGLVLAVRDDGLLLCCTYVREHDIYAWAWWDTQGTVEAVCSIPEGQEDAVYIQTNRTINGVTKRYIERLSSRVVTPATLNQYVGVDCAGIYNGAATSTITGLDWLERCQVVGLADGNAIGPLTVTGGAVTLPVAASYVVLGLSYSPELEQLDLASQGAEIKVIDKQVVRVGVEVDNSRGLMGGQDFDHLVELKQRQVSDNYGPVGLASQLYRMTVQGRWAPDGRVCLRQASPLPLTVVSLTREVDFGDS